MTGRADFEDDAAAVAAALEGRQAGYVWLMDCHREPVFRFIRGHVRHDEEALDVTQECFVSAFAALGRYDPARSFRNWLFSIAINKCRDWGRRRAVRNLFTFALPLEEAFGVRDVEPDPEQVAAANQGVARIRAALTNLPAKLRNPILLCSIEGLSQDQAAEILGISRKAVETRIYRARQKLSEMLEG